MFRKKHKTIRVELVNPMFAVHADKSTAAAAKPEQSSSPDFALKLLGFAAVMLHEQQGTNHGFSLLLDHSSETVAYPLLFFYQSSNGKCSLPAKRKYSESITPILIQTLARVAISLEARP